MKRVVKKLLKSIIPRRYFKFFQRAKRAISFLFEESSALDSEISSVDKQVVLPVSTEVNSDREEYLWPWNYIPEPFPDRLPSGRPWPKISVVTPSYNYGEYIEETIRSVILQGYPNLEYIVVDGDSTDHTKQILERYKAEISICISEPDEGQTDALNKGFRQATGDILTWLNSDDLHLPDTLKQVAIAFDTYRCDLVVGGCQLIQDRNRSVLKTHHCSLPVGQLSPLPYRSMLDFGGDWLSGKFFMGPEVFWTRSAWESVGGMLNENLNFGMDYDVWLRMARKNMVCYHSPQTLAIFRIHDRQKTIFSGRIADYPEHVAISRYYQVLDGIEIPDRERQLVTFLKADGSGTELVDIKATLPLDEFVDRPLVLYNTAYGKYYLPFDGTLGTVTRKVRSGKLESPEVIEIARKYVHPGSTVIEVGTRFGQTTVLLARMTGHHGQVLAFESDKYVFYALQKTLVANDLHNVRPYFRHVGNGDVPQSSGTAYAIDIDDLGITNPVSFMKISVDGSGLRVLQGAVQTILRHKPVILLQDKLSESLIQFVHSIGYKAEKIPHSEWLFINVDTTQHECLSVPSSVNSKPLEVKLPTTNLCKLLKCRSEVRECTDFLHRNGFVSHNLVCKDWDIAHVVSEVGDGNFLDMGSSDSYILKNLALKNIKGDMYGIDLNDPDVLIPRVQYLKGDLMNTGLPSEHFKNISCLSVLEHGVDFERFAAEVSRLLQVGGRLFVTFDYWEPKIVPPIRLYNLAWQPLDKRKVCELIEVCHYHSLRLVNEMDWELGEPVIEYGYYAPHPDTKYTFGMVVFEKVKDSV
jgi:glycosyltransferase involved in cell wall biosynthesis/SAM-dependent methyltransferase